MTKVLPLITLALSAGASAVYAFHGDVRQAVYWAAATVITGSVTL